MARVDSSQQDSSTLLRVVGHVVALGALVALVTGVCGACTGTIGSGNTEEDDGPVVGSTAGGMTNIISDGWEIAPVRHGNSLKMLKFSQMKNEVLRATTVAYAKWDALRPTFGVPDFATRFDEDRTPTATKIVMWRKVAYSVCKDMVAKEQKTPAIFSSISPSATIGAEDPAVAKQVEIIFTRFFLEPPSPDAVSQSIKTLTGIVAKGGSPTEAWGSLCMAYLSSMRFLTY